MIKEFLKQNTLVGPGLIKASGWLQTWRNKFKLWLFYYQNREVLKPNKLLKNSTLGKRCFILATGPSINKMDLKKLKGELCISVSNFFIHPHFNTIKPEYHIFAASHSPISYEQFKAWFQDAEKHMPEGQKVLVGLTDKVVVDTYQLFKKQRVFYYATSTKELAHFSNIDMTKQTPIIQTSPHTAIYLALYLGVSKLYLLGADHDWILHYGETRHFYDEKKSALTQTNYNEWTKDFEFILQSQVNLWRIYKSIKRYCEKRDVTVENCTPGSLLDVFPKKKLEDVLTEKNDCS